MVKKFYYASHTLRTCPTLHSSWLLALAPLTFHLDHTSVPWAVWNPRHTKIITSPIHGAFCSGTPVTAAIDPCHVSGSHIDVWSPVVPAQLQLPFRQQTLALTLVTILRTPRRRGLIKSKTIIPEELRQILAP
ncbi:hypothetical protein CSOJ01_01668 [Colletotrichum sojae]|uniref:Uncharacterized protein n=1 Tax=Colletotrichum sojae TaxID=2175907 RepID=A0A8H6JTV5_9PEZI|nr:hypothetical protein CSOJ01_01668 [Colletotrichum sojae]